MVSLAAGPQQLTASATAVRERVQASTDDLRVDLPVSCQKINSDLAPGCDQGAGNAPCLSVEIIAKQPTIIELLGPDYLIGPVPYGGMTHQEF